MLTRRQVVPMARACKEAGATVIVGGPDPANYAAEYLAHGADVAVIGEGELTLAALLPHLARHGLSRLDEIAGIAFRRDDGEVVRTAPRPYIADLDAQPFPDRAGIDVGEYLRAWRDRHGAGSLSLITARGCPYTCTWCSHAVFGNTHRRRSPANVAAEVEALGEAYGPELLWYADDVFTMDARWVFAYADELRRRRLHIPFETITREDRLDEELIRTLADMGCYRLWIGAESGSQRVLDAMRRRTDAGRVRQMVALLQKYGIEAGLFVMLGYEGETVADIEATAAHLRAARADTFLTAVAYPVKGTPYYDQVADRVRAPGPWETISDQDLTVAGRHSRRFYAFAGRWLASGVAARRHLAHGEYARAVRSFVSAGAGRLGMRLTAREVERGW